MVIVTMEPASVERDLPELIAQFNHAPMTVCQEDLALTTLAFAQRMDTSTVPSSCAPMTVTQMDIVKMEAVFAVLTLPDLNAKHQFVSEVAAVTACA